MFAFILVFLLASGCSPTFALDTPTAYLEDLQRSAQAKDLAHSPAWLNLLHYKRHPLTGRIRSLADDHAFFAAPDGDINAQAELNATLASFFQAITETATSQPTQCRYIARFNWLNTQLQFDSRLPRAPCNRYNAWRSAISPQGLTLIYASAYLNSPASMYGHTMFRVDQAGQRPNTETLAYTLSYAADGDANDGIGFAAKGLIGLYPGLFSSTPYYLRVREYSDLENRDIWEYQLNLSQPEIDMVLAHAWELGTVRFDYYFFDENCSYHILSLLDVARPSLHLTDQFVWHTIPIDTVKAAMATPGLVKKVRYRPSQLSVLQARADALNTAQITQAKDLTFGIQTVAEIGQKAVSADQSAEIFDFADLYLSYQQVLGGIDRTVADQRLHTLRLARSSYPVVASPTPDTPPYRPDQGHGSGRISLGYGQQDQASFVEIGFRPALHDLLDPEPGYTRGAQIEFGDVTARIYEHSHVEIERLNFINIASLSPRNTLSQPKSWRARWGLERLDTRAGKVFTNTLAGSTGVARDITPHFMAYGTVDLRADYVAAFGNHTSWGAGASVGGLWDIFSGWRLIANIAFMDNSHAAIGIQRTHSIASRWALSPDYALVLQAQHVDAMRSSDTVSLQVRRYF